MNRKLSYTLLAAAAACGASLAEPVYTTPVGYMTIPIPGTNNEVPSKLQLANQGLLPSGPAAVGGGASVTFEENVLIDTDGTWSPGDFVNGAQVSHVLEITSDGPLKGALSWITSTAAEEIETSDDLSAAGAGASYRIWETYTIGSLFGNPPAASVLGGGSTELTADNVQILDPTTNTYTSFFYQNSGKGGTGWKSSDSSITNPGNYAIFPNDGMVILRKQPSDGELVVSGGVKTGPTKVRVEGNGSSTVLNILANQFPVDQLTPASSGLYTGNPATGLKGGSTELTADNLLVFDAATNTYTTFFYQDSGKGGTGWKSSDSSILTPADYAFPASGALLIQRKLGNSFSWTVPSVNVGQ